MRTAALVLGAIAVAVPLIAAVLTAVSIATASAGGMMVTALLVVPAAILIAVLLGIVAVVLALVSRAKHGARSGWVLPFVLGLVGIVALPVVLVVVSLFVA